MVAPAKRHLKKKFVKVTKSTKEIRFRDTSKGHNCAICGKKLQGVPKPSKKLSKTEKRPSVMFGGILCSVCRNQVFDDAIMLKIGLIEEKDVSFKKKYYITQALKHIDI